MKLMHYAERFANVPRALAVLAFHPDGLAISTLAAELGLSVPELRIELLTYYLADVDIEAVGLRSPGVVFLGPDGQVADAADAERVRLVSARSLEELGVEYLGADVLGPLYRAATDLATLEPDNQVLASATRRLHDTWLAGVLGSHHYGSHIAAALEAAARSRRRVEVVYSRAWRPGVTTRTIDPYRVVSTKRGYEVDAGPPDETGAIRTFLVPRIRSFNVLEDTYDVPSDLDRLLEANRAETAVSLVVPVDARWVVERFAERTQTGRADDLIEVTAHVLPPVAERVGLILAIAGPDAFVVAPRDLVDAGERTARRLLEHHGLA